MELQKINVKVFFEERTAMPLADFIDVFHAWIQATDGIYHDVADYSHMQAGAGIVLVAHDANVSIDETGARRGLLYSQKRRLPGSDQENLRRVLQAALGNCRRLEGDPTLRGKVKFSGSELLIAINDRLAAPNTEESFQRLRPEFEFLAKLLYYGDTPVALERDKDPRKRLNVRIKAEGRFDVEKLLSRLRDH